MLGIVFQAWELSTFSALPVPMLRQVYHGGQKQRFCVGGVAKMARWGRKKDVIIRAMAVFGSWGHLGPSWARFGVILGHLGAILRRSWVDLGAILGPSWPTWGHLGRSWGHLGRSWGNLGQSWGDLGAALGAFWLTWGHLGPILRLSWPFLGQYWAVLVRSWGHLGAILGCLRLLLRL